MIEKFKTTGDKKTYKDQPGILCAVAQSIGAGLSLQPADTVILLDGEWRPDLVSQAIGRVRRSDFVQKAA